MAPTTCYRRASYWAMERGTHDATQPIDTLRSARSLAWVKALACGLAFAGFGIGWVLLSLLVVPALWIWPGTLYDRRHRCQRLIGRIWVFFHDCLRWVGLIDFDPRCVPSLETWLQAQGIRGPVVVAANHPSLVDVTAIVAALGPMCFVVKESLVKNALFGPLLRLSGHVSQAHAPGVSVVEQGVARLRAGHHLLLFPEGTRSPPGKVGRFRMGAVEIALRAGVPVVPVAISVDPPALYKGFPWYAFGARTVRMRLRPLPPVEMECRDARERRGDRDTMRRLKGEIQAALPPGGSGASGPEASAST